MVGWIETRKRQAQGAHVLTKEEKGRALHFAKLANDVYRSETGQFRKEKNNTTKATPSKNWIELLKNDRDVGINTGAATAFFGRLLGFNAMLYKLENPEDKCWVLSFEGSSFPSFSSWRDTAHSLPDWLLANLPTTLDSVTPPPISQMSGVVALLVNILDRSQPGLSSKFPSASDKASGAPAKQYELADLVVSRAKFITKRDRLVLTGHSLGGGLAQYAALKHDLEAIVFNSAGVGVHAIMGVDTRRYHDTICHLMTTPEPDVFARLIKATKQMAEGAATVYAGASIAADVVPVMGQYSQNMMDVSQRMIQAGSASMGDSMRQFGENFGTIKNAVVTTYTDPLSRHLGTNYLLGVGGHDMKEVLRLLEKTDRQ